MTEMTRVADDHPRGRPRPGPAVVYPEGSSRPWCWRRESARNATMATRSWRSNLLVVGTGRSWMRHERERSVQDMVSRFSDENLPLGGFIASSRAPCVTMGG